MREIVVVDHDPQWPVQFEELRSALSEAVGELAESIEHVGSTSVPGLAAKPVIDVDVVVAPENVTVAIERLVAAGYEHLGDLGIPDREALKRPDAVVAHNLYVCPTHSQALANHRAVRDRLREDPEAARRYGDLKKRLAREHAHDIGAYGEAKTEFLVGILRESGFSSSALEDIVRMNRKDPGRTPDGGWRMRLLLLGASGRTGRWVSRLARERGHDVTAAVRPETRYDPADGVLVERGDVLDREFLRRLLPDHDVVLSCLGLRRATILPWSRLLTPADFVQRVMVALSAEITAAGQDARVIWISAGGVRDSRAQTTRLVRAMIDAGNLRVAYEDLAVAEEAMDASGIDHVAVRPVTLANGPTGAMVGPVHRYGFLSFIRRSDVARWMVDVAEDPGRFEGKAVLLGVP